MARQRWGSFSVRDHLNTRALATDVLLYDRLVFPIPPKGDEKALAHWRQKRWDPDFLDSRLEQLKVLTRTYLWGHEQHLNFRSHFDRLQAQFDLECMAKEARGEIPYQMTRMLIAQDEKNISPKGRDINVVAAYQTRGAFSSDFILRQRKERDARLGYLVSFMIHVPTTGNEDANLETAISIARNPNFQRKRRALYGWQESALARSVGDKADLEEFQDLVEAYNAEVKTHVKSTRKRFAFTLLTTALGIGGAERLIDWAGGSLDLVGVATSTGVPMESGPTAMFHHIDRMFGRP